MKITILCSSPEHPVNLWLHRWIIKHARNHSINLVRTLEELDGGDILFLVSCSKLVTSDFRKKFKKTLVIHASDLPKGRGWSPHIWEILNGKSSITVSLLEAEDKVDSGNIWEKKIVHVSKTDLIDDINKKLFEIELELMDFAIENYHQIKPKPQDPAIEPSYYRKRSPLDSELDINKSIKENFNLIRVCDPSRYPAFFYFEGKKFNLYIEKVDE